MVEPGPHKPSAAPRAAVNSTGELRQLGAGRKLGRYTLLRRIAAGGMAEVYAARSHGVSGFEKKVAIKKILPQFSLNARFVDMLVDEAKIAVTLTHPNIAQIYELGLEDETYYIVMEFVDGRPLNRLLQKVDARGHRTIPIEHAVHIVAEVSKGLYHAHEQRDHRGQPLGIVHRDVSPQNVMIAHTGDVKLIDFGIARAEGRAAQTNVGTIKGKLRYLAPEIAMGLEPDHRVDVYCCGIVLFELLTGEAMFAPRTDVEAIEMASQAKVRSPRLSNPQVPVELEEIVMRALVRDRDHRYPNAKALYVDLRRFLNLYAPAFVSSELGDYMQALFEPEIEEDRRLDRLAEKVVEEVADPARSSAPSAPAAPAAPSAPAHDAARVAPGRESSDLPPSTGTRSGGYRELVTRSSIDLVAPGSDLTPASGTSGAPVDTAQIAATRPLVQTGATRATVVSGRVGASDDTGSDLPLLTSPSLVEIPAPVVPRETARPRPSVARWVVVGAAVVALALGVGRVLGSRSEAPAPRAAAGVGGAAAATAPGEAPVVTPAAAPIPPLPVDPERVPDESRGGRSPTAPDLPRRGDAADLGRLMVEVAPTVAIDVAVDGRTVIERAMPPVRVEVPVGEAPQTITISAPGYQPSVQTRRLARGNEILVTASLDPIRTTVTLTGLEVGARVSADLGTVEGALVSGLEFGSTVTLRIQRPGMRDATAKVLVDDPAGVTYEVPRGQAVARGTLRVSTRPSSDVYVDDRLVGRTPFEGLVPAGTRRVTLKRGSEVHRRNVSVVANKVNDVTHQW